MKLSLPKTLKSKLILNFTLVTLIPSIMISMFFYLQSRRTIENSMMDNAQRNISYILENIDKQMQQAGMFSDWLFINKDLQQLLTLNRDFLQEQPAEEAELKKSIRDSVSNQMMISPIGHYIANIVVSGLNGEEIRSVTGTEDFDPALLKNAPWVQAGISRKGGIYWSNMIDNPGDRSLNPFLLPMVRRLNKLNSNEEIGWCLINFRLDMMSDVFKNYKNGVEDALFVIDSRGTCIASKDSSVIGMDMNTLPFVKRLQTDDEGSFFDEAGGEKHLIVYKRSAYSGLYMVQVATFISVRNQILLLMTVTLAVLVASLMITSGFTVFLSFAMTKPLKAIQKRLKDISAGNFRRDIMIEGEDEFGMLGRRINDMAVNIDELMQEVIRDEADKRRLELAFLQNQINPHFLYNTLNSIRWMATIQKADSIKNMVSSLGNLLKATFRDQQEKITVQEELDLLDNYIYIQQVRYGSGIQVVTEANREAAAGWRILKFLIQPLVENAMFHGIEPKGESGEIRISIREEDKRLCVSVRDNGVGIPEKRLEEIQKQLEENYGHPAQGRIGLLNVHKRIRLTYGPAYGVKIDSSEGYFTEVTAVIPVEVSDAEVGDH